MEGLGDGSKGDGGAKRVVIDNNQPFCFGETTVRSGRVGVFRRSSVWSKRFVDVG